MEFNLEHALHIIDTWSSEELQSLSREDFEFISNNLSPEDFQTFIFAKNIKVFGGINNYVNDFFSKGTINTIKAMNNNRKRNTLPGLILTLRRMLMYDDLSQENRIRINNAILDISGSPAPAAGGKRKTRRYIPHTTDAFNITVNTDFRSNHVKTEEDKYIYTLLQNEQLYNFACKLLFLTINHCKIIGLSKIFIINILLSSKFKGIIIKLGYNLEDSSRLYNIQSLKEFIIWNKERNITFLQIMSAFYKFQRDNEFVKKCIEHDKVLMKNFMDTVCKYFKLPRSITYLELKDTIIEKSYGQWFYLWVITFLQSSKVNLMHRHADIDSDYIRIWASDIEFGNKSNISKYALHTVTRKNIKFNQLKAYLEKKLVLGKTYMRPRLNGVWFNLMNKYKKEVIAGPSSSAILGYQIIFDISKILPKTEKNKVLLLLCMIADYSIYYHSMSEVLQTYVSEAELPPYNLEINDLKYLKILSDKYLKM